MKSPIVLSLAFSVALGVGVVAAGTSMHSAQEFSDGMADMAAPHAAPPPADPQLKNRFERPDRMSWAPEFPTFEEVASSAPRWWKYKGSAWENGCLIDYYDDPLNPNYNDRDSWSPSAACCCDAPNGVPECPPEYC